MMTTRTMSLGKPGMGFLKETLDAQQELLQKLYNELDVERESSATAADETLSMILRLQGEKAALEMEASQYKRIAEEKMCHAHETLETFQELIYNKEMQIASLEFQVQAYKFKLSSLGFDDLASSDLQYPENMLRKNGLIGEISSDNSSKPFRRGNSLPPRANNGLSRRGSTVGAMSAATSPRTVQENPYSEDIKKLDERVKGFTCLNNLDSSIYDPSLDTSQERWNFHENSEKVQSVETCGESQCSTVVEDIFEVPQCCDNHQGGAFDNNIKPETGLGLETRNIKPDIEVIDWEKQPLLSSVTNRNSPRPKDMEEKSDGERKPLSSPKTNDGKTDEKKILLKHPTFGVADFELKQFNRRLKQLEDGRFLSRVREIDDETEGEELKLLREIMEKVEAVQSELTSLRTDKPPPLERRSFGCFKEVMQCFLP